MDEPSAMEALTASKNDNDASNSTEQPQLQESQGHESGEKKQEKSEESESDETTKESPNIPDPPLVTDDNVEEKENTEEDMIVEGTENDDKSNHSGDENMPSSSDDKLLQDHDGESNSAIEQPDIDNAKSPPKSKESDHPNADNPSNESANLENPVTNDASDDQKVVESKTANQDDENETSKDETSKAESNNSPNQSSNSVFEVDDNSAEDETKKTDTAKSKPELELSADQEQHLLDDSFDDPADDSISIDLDASNDAEYHGQDGSDDDDEAVQEVHDVEDESIEEERLVDGQDRQDEDEVVTPLKPSLLTEPQQIQELEGKVTSLQTELEATQKKLARAEKKLNRTKRHKESSESYNYDLRKRVKHLKKELHRHKKDSKKTFAEVSCQTSLSASMETAGASPSSSGAAMAEDQDDVIEIPSTSTGISNTPRYWGGGPEDDDPHQSLADSLKATAEAALSNSGYVLDPNSGLYYDYSTGYYYDPNNHLYYDPTTGVYYFYDQRSRTYQFHSQVEIDPSGMIPHGGWDAGRPRRGKKRRDKRQRRDTGDRDDMECEVIEVLDDDSPESKRPRKNKRKQKQKGKAPHTASSPGDNNEEGLDPESATTSKDADKEVPTDGEMDDPESSSAPAKEKSSRKKSSKRSPKKRSASQKAGKADKEEGADKTVDESSGANTSQEGTTKDADDNEDKEDDQQKSADDESEQGADSTPEKDKKEKDESEPSTSSPKPSSPKPSTSTQEESKSDDEDGEDREPQSDSVNKDNKQTTDDDPSEQQPPATDKKKDDTPKNDEEDETEEGEVEEEEIMEVEDKRKAEIEEITILDSDSDDSDMEEGELSDSSAGEEVSSSDYSSDIESDGVVQEHIPVTRQDYPPCIRMIVTRSDQLQLGSLYVVTCTGGTIGREGSSHVVTIPELGVSKQHADIKYQETLKQYCITDLGSQNGTLINGKMLSKARSVSEPHPVSHKDYLTVGSTTLRIHIHPGDETCDECEPGQVQALIAQLNPENNQVTYAMVPQADKEQMRRKELRKLKKKYNLAKDNYRQQNPSTSNAGYADRAEARRQTVGSDNPFQPDDAPASVDRAIGESNVGRKMLEKMGWKEGKGLGKKDAGIREPIQVLLHNQKSGLGAGGGVSMDQAQYINQGGSRKKNERWQKAKARFDRLQQHQGEPSSTASAATNLQWVKGSGEGEENNGLYDVEDLQEECIEILSPGGSEDGQSPMDEMAVSIPLTITTETTSTVEKSTSGVELVTSPVSPPAPMELPTEHRPKIQMKILGKRGKEQLPTSSVVLDDGEDEDEEEMEVTQGEKKTDSSAPVTNGADGKDTTASGQGDETETTTGDKTNDKDIAQNDGAGQSDKTGESSVAENETSAGGEDPADSQRAVEQGNGDAATTVADSSAKGKWVKIGEDGGNDEAGDGGDASSPPRLDNEAAGPSEGSNSSKTDKPDSQNDSQSETQPTGRKTRRGGGSNKQSNSETASSSKTKKADSSSQGDSQSPPSKGRKSRRTRQSAKNKEEDMFADL